MVGLRARDSHRQGAQVRLGEEVQGVPVAAAPLVQEAAGGAPHKARVRCALQLLQRPRPPPRRIAQRQLLWRHNITVFTRVRSLA